MDDRIDTIEMTCYACPSQWDVKTKDGRDLYIRYRWGYLSISLVKEDGPFEQIYGEQLGDSMDGSLTTFEMMPHLTKALNELEASAS